MLYIIATPIGNIKDISLRAIECLLSAKIIFCEDTRVAEKLIALVEKHIDLSGVLAEKHPKPRLISYHKFNEKETVLRAIELLQNVNGHAALISDAGTPAISDPGQVLIEACHTNKIPITTIPGPCAFVSAFSLSGFHFDRAQFVGFLPKNYSERKSSLYEALRYDGITAAYESPLRLFETLLLINELAPKRRIACIREISKLHEEILVMPVDELIDNLRPREESHSLKGEIVLVIDSPKQTSQQPLSQDEESSKLINQVLAIKEKQSISLSEACALVAKASGVKKGFLYNQCLRFLS